MVIDIGIYVICKCASVHYACMYVSNCAGVQLCKGAYVHVYIRASVQVCKCVCMYMCKCTCVHVCMCESV